MNQTIWQKLKRVKLSDLWHIFLCIFACPCAVLYKLFNNELWLFCDTEGEARDNAYWLFKYVKENYPDINVVFAIDKESADYDKVNKIGKVIQYGSFKHWIFYLSALHVISSHKASGPNAAICYVLERFRLFKGNKIFLQHGIIKDDISFLYYKYTNIRLFTCSTQRELEYVRENYGYPENDVQLLGLCRFDELLKEEEPEKMILIMPTWRKWLSHPTEGTSYKKLDEKFVASDYYKYWGGLLSNLKFLEILDHHDMNVVFYLHREAQKYSKFFECNNSRIRVGTFPEDDVQRLLKKAQILITDYSSVAMDFAILNRPLLYFQFDYSAFRDGHLGEGYFDYELDGFGPVCYDEEQLLNWLVTYIAGNQDRIYQKRRDEFFTLRDQDNCKRTYDAIKRIG